MDKISFVINTAVNELEYVKLLLNSLQKNLDHDHHEIIDLLIVIIKEHMSI